jgi:RNA polymerase sigma-70 factor (ECF subfamily)
LQHHETINNLMVEYGTEILHLAYSYVRNTQTAEDLTQEIFIKCYEKLDTFEGKSSLHTWLYRLASNHCKDYLRSWHHRKIFVSGCIPSFLTSHQDGPENQLIKDVENKALVEAIFQLPVKYREVIFLYYYQECSLKEISEICNLNLNTVKSRLTKAKELLKKHITERGDFDGRKNAIVEEEPIKGRIS